MATNNHTVLTLRIEGWTNVPLSVDISFDGEVHPVDMLDTVRDFNETMENQGGLVAMIKLLDTPEVSRVGPQTSSAFYSYSVSFSPEEGKTFCIENDMGESFCEPIDEWTEKLASSCA